jgi:lipoprotein-anchoring transpeptidase ErfK/SrfK
MTGWSGSGPGVASDAIAAEAMYAMIRTRSPNVNLRDVRGVGRLFIACAALLLGCAKTPPSPQAPLVLPVDPPASAPESEEVAAPPACMEIVRIEVWKGERTLLAYCKRGAVIAMPVAIGRQEIGPKRRAGDHKTPEGEYRVSGVPRIGRFHLFIPIDYPSVADAESALSEGRVSASDYERIVSAHEMGLVPPIDTALGGDLGLHGEGERWAGDSRYHDWTFGCIALSDADIEYLSNRLEVGAPVVIHP